MAENAPEIVELLCEEYAGMVIQTALNYPCQQQYKDDLVSIALKHLLNYAQSHDINSLVPFGARIQQTLSYKFFDYFRSIYGRNFKLEDGPHKREFTSLNNPSWLDPNVEVGDLLVDESTDTRKLADVKLIHELFDILVVESKLSDREAMIAYNHIVRGCTLHELAVELKVTESRVSQLYALVEAKLHDTHTRLYGKKPAFKNRAS